MKLLQLTLRSAIEFLFSLFKTVPNNTLRPDVFLTWRLWVIFQTLNSNNFDHVISRFSEEFLHTFMFCSFILPNLCDEALYKSNSWRFISWISVCGFSTNSWRNVECVWGNDCFAYWFEIAESIKKISSSANYHGMWKIMSVEWLDKVFKRRWWVGSHFHPSRLSVDIWKRFLLSSSCFELSQSNYSTHKYENHERRLKILYWWPPLSQNWLLCSLQLWLIHLPRIWLTSLFQL